MALINANIAIATVLIQTYTHIHTNIYTYKHIYIQTFIHTNIYTYIHIYIDTSICMHIYNYTYIHLYIHPYIYTSIHTLYTYIHTYIHLYIHYIHTSMHKYIHNCALFHVIFRARFIVSLRPFFLPGPGWEALLSSYLEGALYKFHR